MAEGATTPKVYVICDNNCKFEGMTKEQILAAIAQAVETGTVGDIDAGFITTIKTINGIALKFFVGEQAAYDELSEEEKKNLFAIITNDATKEGLLAAIEGIKSGDIKVGYAAKADTATKADSATKADTATKADSATKASTAATLDGLKANSFRGNGTAFNYEPLVGKNIDYYGNFEGHYFVINASGTLPTNFCGHGFLDVDKFSGTEFAPNGQGAEPIARQTFREYNTAKTWVRTYNHNATVGGVWTAWEQTAGDGMLINALGFTLDHNAKTVSTPIGSLLTLGMSYETYSTRFNDFKMGETITDTLKVVAGSSGVNAECVELDSTNGANYTLLGVWQSIGFVSMPADSKEMAVALIRRIA